jgi:Mg2+/Co2+ transporter CorB
MSDAFVLIVIAIIILLLLSAFFSGSETALTGASRPRMHQLERDGNWRARMVNRLRRHQERLIGGILVGNNIVNILASALATSLLIDLFGDAGIIYATVIMSLLVLVFSEVLPKTYAIRHADRVALYVAPLLRPVVASLSPLTRLIEAIVRSMLHIVGDRGAEQSRKAREEEIRGAIGLHADADEIAADEGVMLRGVLDLDDIEVGEIMTHRTDLEMIDADLSPTQIVKQVLGSQFTRLPLYRGDPDNVIGVLHAKALLRDVQNHNGHINEIDIPAVAAKPWFVPESTDCLSQLQAFRQRREHFALVIDEYGALQGVVSLEDIIEEIVGEIADEYDIPVAGVHRQEDGSYIVDGRVTIRDLNREFAWDLPDEEAATIAGLVLHEARFIPEEGQSFAFYGFRFDVLRREANQIRSLRIAPWHAEDENEGSATEPESPADNRGLPPAVEP